MLEIIAMHLRHHLKCCRVILPANVTHQRLLKRVGIGDYAERTAETDQASIAIETFDLAREAPERFAAPSDLARMLFLILDIRPDEWRDLIRRWLVMRMIVNDVFEKEIGLFGNQPCCFHAERSRCAFRIP